jgi:hypothetical protein
MHGVFDGQLVQSKLGRYGSELLLGRTIEPDPCQTAAGSKRVIHLPQLERFGRAPPISVDRTIDDHPSDARFGDPEPREIGDIVSSLSRRVEMMRWWDEDRGPIDSLQAVGVARPTVVAFVQREGSSSDHCSDGNGDRK